MKKAFSMIELIVVIVLIGILAFFLMPKGADTKTLEAARQIISHIRYAQHLALNNDKFDSNDENWYKKFWRVSFSQFESNYDSCKIFSRTENKNVNCVRYIIWQDTAGDSKGNPNSLEEIALDPAVPGKRLYRDYSGSRKENVGTDKMNLSKTYGIIDISFENIDGSTKGFMFDDLGRIYQNATTITQAYANQFARDFIRIKLTGKNDDKVNILVFTASGYACVENGKDCVASQTTK